MVIDQFELDTLEKCAGLDYKMVVLIQTMKSLHEKNNGKSYRARAASLIQVIDPTTDKQLEFDMNSASDGY